MNTFVQIYFIIIIIIVAYVLMAFVNAMKIRNFAELLQAISVFVCVCVCGLATHHSFHVVVCE